MRSRFSIMGHPIHPALVAIPIGLFAWAFVCDIVFVARDHDQAWYDMGFWAGIAAVVTALVAALPGFGDYMTVARKSDASAIATAHMTLNLVIVGMYFIAILLMLDNGATSGGQLGAVIALHGIGTGLLAMSGWLGGEMVFRHHIGIVSDSAELAREEAGRHEMQPRSHLGQEGR
jgi:uncharacterized membrane protein